MASIIGVETLQHTNGTTAATIDSSGLVTLPNSVYLSRYILNSDATVNGAITDWVAPSLSKQVGTIGTAVTHSSGNFSFPITGIWKITAQARLLALTTDSTVGVDIMVTVDNNTYTRYGFGGEGDGSDTVTGSVTVQEIINVDDITNVKVQIAASSISGSSKIYGTSNNDSRTQVIFERIANAQ